MHKEFNYSSFAAEAREKFGSRVQKLSIHAGFSCPNRDGSKGIGGCKYCLNEAFNPSYCQRGYSIKQQIEEGKKFHQNRYRNAKFYVAYFQTYTNTYADLETLKSMYEEALSCEGIVGIVIGTRPDCLPEEVLQYLEELSKRCYLRLEIGIESLYDKTLKRINRCHTAAETLEAYTRAAAHSLPCTAHLIIGLPGESDEEILQEATMLSSYPALDSLKLHQLQIIKNTIFEKEYQENPSDFRFYTLEEYIDLVIDFLERLSPHIKIERLAGEVPPRYIAGPYFDLRSERITERLIERMKERGAYQGRLYKPNC